MPQLSLTRGQLSELSDRRSTALLRRLDEVLLGFNGNYAGLAPDKRLDALGKVVALARSHGIREELNLGLFAVLLLQFGGAGLREPEPQEILADADRSGAAKVFQLWAWHRRKHPDAPVFQAERAAT
ncbi:MAG: hypothetical protein JWQ76_3730 [Ramlibacter sp.]|nr:hypothetical protein [Ramlibacter sp.]